MTTTAEAKAALDVRLAKSREAIAEQAAAQGWTVSYEIKIHGRDVSLGTELTSPRQGAAPVRCPRTDRRRGRVDQLPRTERFPLGPNERGLDRAPDQQDARRECGMSMPAGTHLAYIVSHETWYHRADHVTRQGGETGRDLNVAASAKGTGGGVAWEFMVREYRLIDDLVLHVEMFDDSWAAFTQVPELFTALASQEHGLTLEGLRGLLDGLGAVDETDRVSPYVKATPS